MAISLSELTGASTSGNVLNEVNSYADFLDSCPRLVNKADPTGATDAVQTVATKQPIALPLIDGEGYLYCTGITGNYAILDSAILPNSSFDVTIDFVWGGTINNGLDRQTLIAQYTAADNNRFFVSIKQDDETISLFHGGAYAFSSEVVIVGRNTVRLTYDGATLVLYLNNVQAASKSANDIEQSLTYIGSVNVTTERPFKGAIFSVTEANGLFDIDFTSPRIPHGATEFTCETGQVVTVNTSGNNPAKVIKRPVLRFIDSAGGALRGMLGQTLSEGYFFGAFSLNGAANHTNRIFGINSTGASDTNSNAFIYSFESSGNLSSYNGGNRLVHNSMGSSARGDMLHEASNKNLDCISYINGANEQTEALQTTGVSAEEFNIACDNIETGNTSIDLEYLAFFPSSITPKQATQIREFINKRRFYYRWDTDGYYFFDPQKVDFVGDFTSVNTLDGYITGSDKGDTDVRSNLTLEQAGIQEAQPYADGYKITFNDNAEYLNFTNGASQSLAGWQIVGTSLGTFAYKVTVSGETELNLLGHLGNATYRQAGDLYGAILLPQDATNRDIQEARKLLIDRGAADGTTLNSVYTYWFNRGDIVEFGAVDTSSVTSFNSGWAFCNSLTSFPLIDTSNGTSFGSTWRDCTSLTSFPLIDTSNGTYFTYTWYQCTNLTSFPLIDTSSATNLQNAWDNCNSLTSFPAIDASNGTNFNGTWKRCSSLTQFPQDAKLGTEETNVDFRYAFDRSGLTSFSTPLPTVTDARYAWQYCSSLTDFNVAVLPEVTQLGEAWRNSALTSFSTELPKATNIEYAWLSCWQLSEFNVESLPEAVNCYWAWRGCDLDSFSTSLPKARQFSEAWRSNSNLTNFSADVFADWNPDSIQNFCFAWAWDGCTSLTAQSVENILVPIANSGKWATNNGTSGGTPIPFSEITISYDVSTGSLTAATLTAIETLNGRGWSVNINNEIIVPNILQLQPAAAYSLRSFDSDADPTVVNVRRSSDGSLSDFTASQVSDGTLEAWVGAGNDGYVTTWYDQSGNSVYNLTQSTASAQPKLVDNGVLVTEGGEAALDFDGSDDELVLNTAISATTDPRTYLAVFTTNDDNGLIVGGNNPSFYDTYGNALYIRNSEIKGKALNNSNGVLLESGITPNATYLATLRLLDTDSSIYVNGTEEATNSNNLYWHSYNTQIGGGQYVNDNMDGTIQEIVIFDTDQSANRAAIEKNINDHFNIY